MSAAPAANPISLEADASLLTSFVNGGLQSALDDHPNLSARDILAWFNDPQTQTDLAKLKDLARAAATLRHSLARFNAIARLDDLCLNSQNESEARRAAIALLSPRRHRPAAKLNTSLTADLPDPQPPISPPPDTRPQAKAPAPSRSEISNSKSPIPSPPASQIPDLKSPTPVSPKHTGPADSSSFRSEITDCPVEKILHPAQRGRED